MFSTSLINSAQAESKAQDSRAEYDEVTKLIKIEVARFEHDRIVDFKSSLDAYLEGVINGQTKVCVRVTIPVGAYVTKTDHRLVGAISATAA